LGNKSETMQKILDVACIEFGTNGFVNASTNQIAKNALVSKGVIFKYFHQKHELYFQVVVQEMDKLIQGLSLYMSSHEENDVFDKIVDIILWKATYAKMYPFASALLLEAVSKPPSAIKDKMMEYFSKLSSHSIQLFFDQIPMDNIQERFSKEDVQKMIGIAVNGLQATYIKEGMTLEYLESIREESIDFLKTVLRGMEKSTW
jgi:TetR/AcrR family transcriptional regulator